MYDLALIGLGRVGLRTVEYLLEKKNSLKILGVDCANRSRVIEERGINIDFLMKCNPSEIVPYLKGLELVATALPSSVVFDYVEALLKNKFNVVDVSYIGFDPFVFEHTCIDKGVVYVPDAGFAPGFSNLTVGYLYRTLGSLDSVEIYVGGIPTHPKPPLYYEVTWSPEDLIEEYTRKARVVLNGSVVEIDPLSEIKRVDIPGYGVFEGFYSDGLHTLLKTIRAEQMFEITIRHPGHLEKIKLLRELGFFDEKPLDIDGTLVSPKRFTAKLFSTLFKQVSSDEAILYVKVRRGDLMHSVLSILRREQESATVDFTSRVFAETILLVLEEDLKPRVHPLESLSDHYDKYLKGLREIGVNFIST